MPISVVFIICTVLSIASERGAVFTVNTNNRRNRDKARYCNIWFALLCVFSVFFIGLRIKYNDTETYIYNYQTRETANSLAEFFGRSYTALDDWGFRFVSTTLKSMGMDVHLFIMVTTCFYVVGTMKLLFKNSKGYFAEVVFLFFATGMFSFANAAIKQMIAMVIAMNAVEKALDNKWKSYFVLMIIAILMHPYSIVYFVVPVLINKRPCGTATIIMIIAVAVMGLNMGFTAQILVKYSGAYTVDGITSRSVNIYRVLVGMVPVILAYVYKNVLFIDSNKRENLYVQLTILSSMLMTWCIFADPTSVGRLSLYFELYFCISLPWMINKIGKTLPNDAKILKIFMLLMYTIYFVYGTYISKSFDKEYEAISIFELFDSASNFLTVIVSKL